jgi:hypothetical protein
MRSSVFSSFFWETRRAFLGTMTTTGEIAVEVVAKFTSKQREAFEAAAAELRKVEQYRAPRDPGVGARGWGGWGVGGVGVGSWEVFFFRFSRFSISGEMKWIGVDFLYVKLFGDL